MCTDQALFIGKHSSKQMSADVDVRGQQGMGFFTGGRVIIMDWYFGQKQPFRLKWLDDGFVSYKHFSLHKMLIDGLELCGLLVDYCDVFISCLDSHSDGTHSLQRIH